MDDWITKYKSSDNWYSKILYMKLYHDYNSKSIREVALAFEVSIGLASENILLGSHLEEIKQCDSRNQALKLLKVK